MNMETETKPAPTTGRVAHPAIADAIELLAQSAQDLTEYLSTADGPDWENNPGTRAAYDKDMATVAALRTAQADIEAPLLARLALVGECSAVMGGIGTEFGEENAKLRQRCAVLEESVKASAEEVIKLKALLQKIVNEDADDEERLRDELIGEARELIAKFQPAIIHLPADDTEGGAL